MCCPWGTCSGPNDFFANPGGVATDARGNVYVSDWSKDRICKFDPSGTFLNVWGETGDGNGQFDGAWALAVDAKNNVYVIDYNHNRVQMFQQPQQN